MTSLDLLYLPDTLCSHTGASAGGQRPAASSDNKPPQLPVKVHLIKSVFVPCDHFHIIPLGDREESGHAEVSPVCVSGGHVHAVYCVVYAVVRRQQQQLWRGRM